MWLMLPNSFSRDSSSNCIPGWLAPDVPGLLKSVGNAYPWVSMHHTESYPTLPEGQFENQMPMHILEKYLFRIAKIGKDGNHKIRSLTRSKSGSTSHDFLLSFTKMASSVPSKNCPQRLNAPARRNCPRSRFGRNFLPCLEITLEGMYKPFVVLRHWCLGRTGASHRATEQWNPLLRACLKHILSKIRGPKVCNYDHKPELFTTLMDTPMSNTHGHITGRLGQVRFDSQKQTQRGNIEAFWKEWLL